MDAVTASRLLERIGLDPAAPPRADAGGLRTVHRAFVATVPYEALSVQLGTCGPLDETELAARVLARRGGYCFEVNTVLAGLLRALGFDVQLHQAVVGGDGPTNHMALVVDLGADARWIADAGLGEGALDPLPLTPGTTGDPFPWRVEEREDGWWVASHPWCSFPGFRIAREPSDLDAFAPHHQRLSTQPDSSFVQTLVVQRPADTTLTTLRARTLTAVSPVGKDRLELTSARHLRRVLDAVFGIPPAALADAQLDRLWANAVAQHDAYVATRARARTGEADGAPSAETLVQVPFDDPDPPRWGAFPAIGALDVATTGRLVDRLGLRWELEVPDLEHSTPLVLLRSPHGRFGLEAAMLPIDADVTVRAEPSAPASVLRERFLALAGLPPDGFSWVVERDVWFERSRADPAPRR